MNTLLVEDPYVPVLYRGIVHLCTREETPGKAGQVSPETICGKDVSEEGKYGVEIPASDPGERCDICLSLAYGNGDEPKRGDLTQ